MAYATLKGTRYNVRVVQDLTENWAVEVYPPPPNKPKTFEPFKNWPVPLCIKVKADSRADALLMGLEHMKKLGHIDDFHLDPSERPAPAAPAQAKAATTTEADSES